ncbi:HEAT repeat domain-containing protein [Haloarchaeobius sp. DFWS5]|uniref:HEAT repeat domain-containing protein n=1 Tax=Haloarchaeobius sp. DFWS5 TaxID=3446114 RepID=UPI003EBA66CD
MPSDSSKPLDGITPETVTPDDVDESAVHAALSSSNPLVQQRGVEVCERLATAGVPHVEPFLDDVVRIAGDDNAAIALRAIAVLATVADHDPTALDGRLSPLVAALDTDIVDVQLAGANLFGTLVVARHDLVTPHVGAIVTAIGVAELDSDIEDFSEVVEDRVTRQTLQEHEEQERQRRTSARQTLTNVVVAVAEQDSTGAVDAVDDLVTLLDDVDPSVAGGAIDALGYIAVDHPEAVAPVRDQVLDCLDDDRTVVRARTIKTLGHLGDDAAVVKLRRVAETDEDEAVRELAEETATFLEYRS